MNSSSTPTQRLVRHALTLAMTACFIAAGWLLLKPLVRPAIAEAAATSTAPWTTKAIEDIQVGDLVLARDEQGTALGWKPVKVVYRRTSYHLRHLTFRDAAGHEQTFETTDEHPFWSVTAQGFVNAGDLSTGDRVISVPSHTPSGKTPLAIDPALVLTLTATHRDEHPAGVTVHNFQVEDFHTYFVAAQGATGPPVLVHNADYDIRTRSTLGRDGATSNIIVERDPAGNAISKRHTVTKDGIILHQHQEHIGVSGSTRRFPDEWTGTTTINAPDHIPTGPRIP